MCFTRYYNGINIFKKLEKIVNIVIIITVITVILYFV